MSSVPQQSTETAAGAKHVSPETQPPPVNANPRPEPTTLADLLHWVPGWDRLNSTWRSRIRQFLAVGGVSLSLYKGGKELSVMQWFQGADATEYAIDGTLGRLERGVDRWTELPSPHRNQQLFDSDDPGSARILPEGHRLIFTPAGNQILRSFEAVFQIWVSASPLRAVWRLGADRGGLGGYKFTLTMPQSPESSSAANITFTGEAPDQKSTGNCEFFPRGFYRGVIPQDHILRVTVSANRDEVISKFLLINIGRGPSHPQADEDPITVVCRFAKEPPSGWLTFQAEKGTLRFSDLKLCPPVGSSKYSETCVTAQ